MIERSHVELNSFDLNINPIYAFLFGCPSMEQFDRNSTPDALTPVAILRFVIQMIKMESNPKPQPPLNRWMHTLCNHS